MWPIHNNQPHFTLDLPIKVGKSLKINPFLKGLAMIFPGQENPFIIFRSKEIYIYSKTNNKIPINLLK